MQPMPSGGALRRGRIHHRGHRDHRGRVLWKVLARAARNHPLSVSSVISVVNRIGAMDPMPSGNGAPREGLAGGLRAPQRGAPGRSMTRDDQNRAMDPMPSGDAGGQLAREGAEAAGGVGGAGAEREVGARAAAMDEPGGAAARETRGRARAGAED